MILATGHTYDRASIERWLAQGHKTCPVTGMRLRHLELTPNFALRSAILDWAAANGIKMPERVTQPTPQPVFKWEEGRAGNILHVSCPLPWVLNVGAGRPPVLDGWVLWVRPPVLAGCSVCGRLQMLLRTGAQALCPSAQHPPARLSIQLFAPLQGHAEIIWAIEVHGDRVYTASADKTVRVWDLNSKRCVQVRAGGELLWRLCAVLCTSWLVVVRRCCAAQGPGGCADPDVGTAAAVPQPPGRCWRATRGPCCRWLSAATGCSRGPTTTLSACGIWTRCRCDAAGASQLGGSRAAMGLQVRLEAGSGQVAAALPASLQAWPLPNQARCWPPSVCAAGEDAHRAHGRGAGADSCGQQGVLC